MGESEDTEDLVQRGRDLTDSFHKVINNYRPYLGSVQNRRFFESHLRMLDDLRQSFVNALTVMKLPEAQPTRIDPKPELNDSRHQPQQLNLQQQRQQQHHQPENDQHPNQLQPPRRAENDQLSHHVENDNHHQQPNHHLHNHHHSENDQHPESDQHSDMQNDGYSPEPPSSVGKKPRGCKVKYPLSPAQEELVKFYRLIEESLPNPKPYFVGKDIRCFHCNQLYPKVRLWRDHIMNDHYHRAQTCENCGEVFTYTFYLHRRTCIPVAGGKENC